MEVNVKLNGRKRKALAQAIGHILETEPVYKGPPTYQYNVGGITVGRDATLSFADNMLVETRQQILTYLHGQGFDCITISSGTADEQSTESTALTEATSQMNATREQTAPTKAKSAESLSPTHISISVPLNGFDGTSLENLRSLIASKSTLIKKAIDADDLSIELTDETISFPWFRAGLSEDGVMAYMQFITALCTMAKKQKRVLAVDKASENEKYAFRCFLLQLGFIGDEYAKSRKILLQNLSGNGSWKSVNEKQKPRQSSKSMNKSPIKAEERRQTKIIEHDDLQKPNTPPLLSSLLQKLFQRQNRK